jgi:hypothetical protein
VQLKPYYGCTAINSRDPGPALQLFRIESERLELLAPFSRQIAEPFDADAAGQAAFYGVRKASEMVTLTCWMRHFS